MLALYSENQCLAMLYGETLALSFVQFVVESFCATEAEFSAESYGEEEEEEEEIDSSLSLESLLRNLEVPLSSDIRRVLKANLLKKQELLEIQKHLEVEIREIFQMQINQRSANG